MDNLFNFDDMAAASSRARYQIAKLFAKYRAPTASEDQPGGGGKSVEIDPKVRRSSDISYRDVHVTMKDGQKVTFKVKQTGDIYQVLVNGKATPIKDQHNQAAAIREIVDVLNARRARFQKALTIAKVPMKRGVSVSTRMQVKQLKSKLVGLDDMIEDAKMELAEIAGPDATPFAEPAAPAPVLNEPEIVAEAPADAAPAVVAEPADDGMDWLRGIIDGTTDITADLKGFRDRIRAAQKVPESAELAGQAAKVLAKAAVAKAQLIVGGQTMDDAAEDAAAEESKEGVTLDAARKINQKGYQFYVVAGGKIESGWEFREDAAEHAKENMPQSLRAEAKIYMATKLKSLGLDANDNACWMTTGAKD